MNVEQIKRWMKQEGLTQKELAGKLHCAPQTINKILSGKYMMSKGIAARIEELARQKNGDIQIVLPAELEKMIAEEAEKFKVSVEVRTKQILADLLQTAYEE